MNLYTATYDQKNYVTIPGFEAPVLLPDMPPERLMRNYGISERDQKYEKTTFPNWAQLTPAERRDLAESEWHRRLNGEWWLIRGIPVYIPGWAHFYFNYWLAEYNALPDFRMEAVYFFQVWNHVVNDPQSMGLFIIKGRRLGETEKALCAGYDMVTRYKASWFGHQNIKDEDAQGNFIRVVKAHEAMQPWFKPLNRGGTSPKKELVLERNPDNTISNMENREKAASVNDMGLRSRIDYRPTNEAEYDGKRLRYYYMDEPGKLDPRRMNLTKQWAIIRPTLAIYNLSKIIGKAMFTTTVENIASGGAIEICRDFWDGSDPNERSATGRTRTGLYRYFRPFEWGYQIDEYGYPLFEEAHKVWQAEVDAFTAKKDWDGLAQYKRQFPKDIRDALNPPAIDCPLHPSLLDAQMELLREEERIGKNTDRHPVRGDLAWSSGPGSTVVWHPNPNGKWCISRHPIAANNIKRHNGLPAPGNTHAFAAGIDPIDHDKPGQGYASDAAIAVYMPFNPMYESADIEYDENGNIANVENMTTDQFVCTYKARPNDPYTFYDDAVKTLVYYGCQAFIERQKPGVIGYMKRHGYENYLAYKPRTIGVGAAREQNPGAHTSASLTNVFLDLVKSHVYTRIQTYRHIELLNNYRSFDGTNMGKCDLLVAAGYAKMLAAPMVERPKQRKTTWTTTPW